MSRPVTSLGLVMLLVLMGLGWPARPVGADPGHDAEPAVTALVEPPAEPAGQGIALVGALRLEPFNAGLHGDVAAYQHLAFVGKWRGRCPGSGVDIIDIADPAAPVKLADTDDHADTSMEDMQVRRIGERDVLAIGLQDCGNDPRAGRTGLELVDVTNPAEPRGLSFHETSQGVHELDLTTTPDGRTLALLAVPDAEIATADDDGRDGTGDLLIVDVSDPTQPVLLSEWGVLDEPRLGPAVYRADRQGGDARVYLHSVRANAAGTRAYLSYWDAGVILLDIGDPARPRYLGRTAFAPGDEGNAHSVAEAFGGRLLIQADEDFSPYGLAVQVSAPAALARAYPAAEAGFAGRVVAAPAGGPTREVAHVGRGCPDGAVGAPPGGDPYLADPAGKIALIERGLCQFDQKIVRAQEAGAIAAIVYNSAEGGDALIQMGGAASALGVQITIPAVFVGRGTGLALAGAGEPVALSLSRVFNGWGYLRFFDISDPAHPAPVSTFATANTANEAVARQGIWSVHNPEVRGTLVFASWYRDGVRAIDISEPAAPREVAVWTGAGAPAEARPVDIWSVVPHGDLLLASDRHFGLYILRLLPGAAPSRHAVRPLPD